MNSKKGVTLAEVVVALAIAAIIGAIAIPSAVGNLAAPRKRACEQNREALRTYFETTAKTNLMLDNQNEDTILVNGVSYTMDAFLGGGYAQVDATLQGCPEGGIYHYNVSTGEISCSKHDDGLESTITGLVGQLTDPNTALRKQLDKYIGKSGSGSSIDSKANAGGQWNKTIIQLAKEAGLDLTQFSWRLYTWGAANYSLYYTPVDISTCVAGDIVPVVRIDLSTGERYEGTTKIEIRTSDTGNKYPVLSAAKKSDLTKV